MNFTAEIYKVGINLCVEVPRRITDKMTLVKGYIPITGKINGHAFRQTLCPVKNAPYRLYVNGPMLKGSGTQLGDVVKFSIEADHEPTTRYAPMSPELKNALTRHTLMSTFSALIPSRQKEIIKYLNNLKSDEAKERNLQKVIQQLNEIKSGKRTI